MDSLPVQDRADDATGCSPIRIMSAVRSGGEVIKAELLQQPKTHETAQENLLPQLDLNTLQDDNWKSSENEIGNN